MVSFILQLQEVECQLLLHRWFGSSKKNQRDETKTKKNMNTQERVLKEVYLDKTKGV